MTFILTIWCTLHAQLNLVNNVQVATGFVRFALTDILCSKHRSESSD